MGRVFIFADEAGCFTFEKKANVSKYFILNTVSMNSCAVGDALARLRRDLAWAQKPLGDYFHASTDKQEVRDAVFSEICKHDFLIQSTVMEKTKAQPQVRATKPRFYKTGWYFHFKHGAPHKVQKTDELMVVTASLGTRKERTAFEEAVQDVLRQTVPGLPYKANFCPSAVDPCLSVVDYCAWAIQRKWESGNRDVRSYDLIKDRITYEYDLWRHGSTHYY